MYITTLTASRMLLRTYKMIPRCFCCNSELTAPTLIDGRMYGYTCAAKIQGGKKARKQKLLPAKIIKDYVNDDGFKWAVLVETPEGRQKVYIDASTLKPAFGVEIDGQLYVRTKRK